jgi:hypothetical protein
MGHAEEPWACIRNSLESLFGKEGPATAVQRNAAGVWGVPRFLFVLSPQEWGTKGGGRDLLHSTDGLDSRLRGNDTDAWIDSANPHPLTFNR